jgi:hypothetical protein
MMPTVLIVSPEIRSCLNSCVFVIRWIARLSHDNTMLTRFLFPGMGSNLRKRMFCVPGDSQPAGGAIFEVVPGVDEFYFNEVSFTLPLVLPYF